MFSIGDKVVYPTQGTGIIDRIENKIFSGKNREYLIIKMFSNNLEIMIPTDNISKSHLRPVSDDSTLLNILSNITDCKEPINDLTGLSSKEIFQKNMEKFKTGLLKDSIEVVHDLNSINKKKPLNSSEKQLLKNAKKFLAEEVSIIKNITQNEASDFISNILN